MRRPPRRFAAEWTPLEPRTLLTSGPAPIRANGVQFGAWGSPLMATLGPPAHVVGQDDGYTTVVLTRSDNRGVSQVRVVTDPASDAVGVNLPPVDELVTFPNLASDAVVRIPITAGAANPGEVDVNLSLMPVSPRLRVDGPTQLRILSSNDAIVPMIVSVEGKAQSIVLRFNKAMDPASAGDVKNYQVTWKAWHGKHNLLGPLALLNASWWYDQSSNSGEVPIRSAKYNPATHSVTLTAGRPIQYGRATGGISVTHAHPAKGADPAAPASVLADLQGNPINTMFAPGHFNVPVLQGLHSV